MYYEPTVSSLIKEPFTRLGGIKKVRFVRHRPALTTQPVRTALQDVGCWLCAMAGI